MTTLTEARVTVPSILSFKSKRKISALTAYDFTFAKLIDRAGVDIILIGDSLGCVIQGYETTLPVTLDEMIYHCRCVSRGVTRALVVGDMPFLTYQAYSSQAVESAGKMLKEGGVGAVKLEGGVYMAETIERLVQVDIPVMGHIGLTPQSYHRMGGHRVQGKNSSANKEAGSKERLIEDALAVQQAGAFAIVLEGIPRDLAGEITERLRIPTIGIGAGPQCDGQILVSYDMLGMVGEDSPKFVKRYAELGKIIEQSVVEYVSEVSNAKFPDDSHSFHGTPNATRSLKLA